MSIRILSCCLLLSAACLFSGCSRAPQLHSANRKILEALQTAVSAKKLDWVEIVEKQIAEKRTKNEMSDAEFVAVDSIIRKAKAGDWKQAQKDSFVLSESQQPTAQDLAMLRSQ